MQSVVSVPNSLALSICAAVAVAAVIPAPVAAHHGPSVETNNRYIRLTPMQGGVRIAYTVYIGEIPGVAERARMNSNGDEILDDSESRAYGDELARALAEKLDIQLDGKRSAMKWSQVDVGLGTNEVDSGAFSIDLIGWICTAGGKEGHSLILVDGYQLAKPGDTELRVNASPGVSVSRSTLDGDEATRQLELIWRGKASPLATKPYYMDYSVAGDSAPSVPTGECPSASEAEDSASGKEAAEAGKSGATATIAILLSVAVAAIVAVFLFLRLRRRKDS